MSKVKGRKTAPASRQRKHAVQPVIEDRKTDAASIVTGLIMVMAVIVAGAALMGGSLSKVNSGVSGVFDNMATGMGFGVADVRVVGLESSPERARLVASLSDVQTGDNMFGADPHTIRRRILSTGQVTEARVYRLWPNQILIHTSPARAAAVWHDGEAWKVIDAAGRTMEGLDAADYADLFRLSGASAPKGVPALLYFLAGVDDLAGQISYAERVSERRWNLRLRSGLLIELPADASVSRAAAELNAANATSSLTHRTLDRIDLRVAGRTFLKPSDNTGARRAPAES
jgi:cell division protein FtsQ